jgi:hypothetical protein
LLSS